jgi:uncharacterized membrane protein (UPF0182 family)
MPELRLVVLALQDRLAYGPTFEAALSSLFGSGSSSVSAAEQPQNAAAPAGSAAAPALDMHGLIAEAGKDFSEYQKLTAEGRMADAGLKLEALKQVLDKMNVKGK